MFLSTEPQTIEDFLTAVNFISPKNFNLKYFIVPGTGYTPPQESGFVSETDPEDLKRRGSKSQVFTKKDLSKTHSFENERMEFGKVPNELPRSEGSKDPALQAALAGIKMNSPVRGLNIVDLPDNSKLLKESFMGFPKNTLMFFERGE